MQAEAVDVGAQGLPRYTLPRRRAAQGRYGLPRAGSDGDAVSDGRWLQRSQLARLFAIGIRLGEVGLAHLVEQRAIGAEPVRASQHKAVQVDVEIGGRFKARHQRDGTALAFVGLELRAVELVPSENAPHHL